ncbi:diaminopimelate decarboxylase [Vacuolonema iberomarrocanum]|uniref:diaminopimelate decarboxylase n=1 Tax=Vacuolonema iberomarrocanum TaxID=3454632 RepID=UPI0019FD3322|nr:diaminopimelate decarboxylase [filamentous cyanobacterium LEGE 07170]
MVSTPIATPKNSGAHYLVEPTADGRSPNQSLLPLTAKVNEQNHLEIGGCDVPTLVEQFQSPLYILDEATLRAACRQYRDAFQRHYPGESLVIYASKAWNCLAVCALIASEGLGIDVVSGGELFTALQAGVSPAQTYFHGNNKSAAELELAITSGATVVVDNWSELHLLVDLAQAGIYSPDVITATEQPSIRILLRLTPGIECHTHDYIRTGSIDSKFGFDPEQLESVFAFVRDHAVLNCVGLHAHIGSQIFEVQPHHDLAGVLVDWMVKATEYGLPIQEIDVGGGLGIRYTESDDPPSIEAWVQVVCEAMVNACNERGVALPRLISEPGRSLIGSACVTAYTVGSDKTIPSLNKTYVTVDGGMSDNPRPITYQSLYRAVVANRMHEAMTETVTVAGKHCESGDIVIPSAQLPKTTSGDVLVVMATGAYNYSMASNYNRLPRPAAVLVHQGEANIILQRETYDDLLRQDRLPHRLQSEQNNG